MSETVIPTRSQMLDSEGRPLTQSLFIEIGYTDSSIYTLKEVDHEWNGKMYPSLKRLYLEEEDPTEYRFATKYLLGWKHWQRLCGNKIILKHIEEWRFELEMKLRSRAVAEMIKNSKAGKIQASQWLANKGWEGKGRGRPSKAEVEREKKMQAWINSEYSADVIRLNTGS